MKTLIAAGAIFSTALLSPALAADFPVKAQPAPPSSNWTGFYIGGNVGYGWGNPSSFITFDQPALVAYDPAAPANYDLKKSGPLGGLQFGYNYQNGLWLVGIEADFQLADIEGSFSSPSIFMPAQNFGAHIIESQHLKSLATVRARAGILIAPSWLAYVTGGLAVGKADASSQFVEDAIIPFGWRGSASATKTGWAAGGGVEWALDHRWSFKVEYLHYDLGTLHVTGKASGFSTVATLLDQDLAGNIVRVGVNYRFSSAP